ncbi:hypothetical protein NA57DRAFT_56670 [Rhizodiscina lignyota]|uniref:Uncharacterized protein n=1 Tax=Rhizodiscina lignyota TaxID=1504668 RepID=A0A9P4M5U7_9PEZI|nr:hypothetical protein NA57DRAFT_56670 [Rhizodiscina lignyota]
MSKTVSRGPAKYSGTNRTVPDDVGNVQPLSSGAQNPDVTNTIEEDNEISHESDKGLAHGSSALQMAKKDRKHRETTSNSSNTKANKRNRYLHLSLLTETPTPMNSEIRSHKQHHLRLAKPGILVRYCLYHLRIPLPRITLEDQLREIINENDDNTSPKPSQRALFYNDNPTQGSLSNYEDSFHSHWNAHRPQQEHLNLQPPRTRPASPVAVSPEPTNIVPAAGPPFGGPLHFEGDNTRMHQHGRTERTPSQLRTSSVQTAEDCIGCQERADIPSRPSDNIPSSPESSLEQAPTDPIHFQRNATAQDEQRPTYTQASNASRRKRGGR